MKKILLFADSLALPRMEAQEGRVNIPFEATYPYLLEKFFRDTYKENAPIVINRAERRRTIKIVLDDVFEEIELKRPDIIIVQVGVVDCAPRVFLPWEFDLIDKLKLVRRYILKFVNRNRRKIIRLRPNRVYVTEKLFTKYLDEFITRIRNNQVGVCFFVSIISPPETLEWRSPGFQRNVDKYNSIICSRCDGHLTQFIDLDTMILEQGGSEKLTVDGIHIGESAHKALCDALSSRLHRYIE